MSKLDGIAAAERIAGDRVAPVVILTAFGQRDLSSGPGKRERCEQAAVDLGQGDGQRLLLGWVSTSGPTYSSRPLAELGSSRR